MTTAANNILQFSTQEQVSPEKEPDKSWLRQKSEPAKWFMRFQIYLDLGPKRTMQAAIDAEPMPNGKPRQVKQAVPGKPQKVSLPGSWSRAAKLWRWKERAEAWDLSEVESRSALLQTIVGQLRFCSPSYRICELHGMAIALSEHLNRGSVPTKTYLALSARLQSVLKDIASELATLNIDTKRADALGLEDIIRSGRIKFK